MAPTLNANSKDTIAPQLIKIHGGEAFTSIFANDLEILGPN
jgi:hypothetical protein